MRSDVEAIRLVLSANLKKYRKKDGCTQEKLAEKAGLSAQTLNDIEGCRRWVSPRTLTKIARALKVSEYELLMPEEGGGEKSSLESLIALQSRLISAVNTQFDLAKDSEAFR
ncbi:MAG: helix-turn-helix transcriptional regulator [Spirochaetaceae bacterium]|jgi:transcriptional regulator with XRE-family HTH domain|nr:helix-turn-helix transcriptional regulator [Spirochaetaceae bacterium]